MRGLVVATALVALVIGLAAARIAWWGWAAYIPGDDHGMFPAAPIFHARAAALFGAALLALAAVWLLIVVTTRSRDIGRIGVVIAVVLAGVGTASSIVSGVQITGDWPTVGCEGAVHRWREVSEGRRPLVDEDFVEAKVFDECTEPTFVAAVTRWFPTVEDPGTKYLESRCAVPDLAWRQLCDER